MRDDLVGLGVAPAERFVVVRLGIELEERVGGDGAARERARRLLGVPDDRFLVGWMGRMTAVKRTDDVLLAFKELRERGVDAALCLVGDGPDRTGLEERAYELGIARHLLSLGYQDAVADWYAAFDVLILPSANEGTPVSVIEALAARRPVSSRPTWAASRTSCATASTASSSRPATPPRSQSGSRSSRTTRRCARGWARPAASACSQRYAVARLVDDVDRLYRSLLATS